MVRSYRLRRNNEPNLGPDWFEVMPEPIALRNRHLIAIRHPMGINTVWQPLKAPNLDLRGVPACPKIDVGPWNPSTVEPLVQHVC